jgi:hypothetical protein
MPSMCRVVAPSSPPPSADHRGRSRRLPGRPTPPTPCSARPPSCARDSGEGPQREGCTSGTRLSCFVATLCSDCRRGMLSIEMPALSLLSANGRCSFSARMCSLRPSFAPPISLVRSAPRRRSSVVSSCARFPLFSRRFGVVTVWSCCGRIATHRRAARPTRSAVLLRPGLRRRPSHRRRLWLCLVDARAGSSSRPSRRRQCCRRAKRLHRSASAAALARLHARPLIDTDDVWT